MATWPGWVAQFLSAASLPNTSATRQWMDDWSTNSISDCRNNPVDVSRPVGGSGNCKKLTASRTAQNYSSHSQAAQAFSRQIHSGAFPYLLRALQSGDPFTLSGIPNVEGDIQKWGSLNFLAFLENTFGVTPGGTGLGGGVGSHATKGWDDFRRQVNAGLPQALRTIDRSNRAALSSLGRRRRVKH